MFIFLENSFPPILFTEKFLLAQLQLNGTFLTYFILIFCWCCQTATPVRWIHSSALHELQNILHFEAVLSRIRNSQTKSLSSFERRERNIIPISITPFCWFLDFPQDIIILLEYYV